MALHRQFIDPYRERQPRLVVGLVAGLLFVNGLALSYVAFLRTVQHDAGSLSGVEWLLYIFGPPLVEPVVLFVALYLLGTRADRLPSLARLLPGIILAAVGGSFLGMYVGADVWYPVLEFATVLNSPGYLLSTVSVETLLYWEDIVRPIGRGIITAVAALAISRSR